jgi:uncharacterized membrane protein
MRSDSGGVIRAGRAGVTALGFALLGLGVSVYLTIEHYNTSLTLACPQTATLNCAKVTTSQWSKIAGVPVALIGLVYFVAMTMLLLPRAWRYRFLAPVRLVGAGAGVLMVMYLVWIELFRVDAICLWCTAVHVCTVAMFVAIVWRASSATVSPIDP